MKISNLEVYGIIYKIENLVNGKVYIGQTTMGFEQRYHVKGIDVERVYKYHKRNKLKNRPYNNYLLNSIEKYEFNSFKVDKVFDLAFSKDELDIKEQCWIQYYNSYKNGYNQNLGGHGNLGHEGLVKENNPSSRKVVQLTLEGDFVRDWNCVSYIEENLGISTSHIISVCNNKYGRKSSGGYLWVYKEEYDENIKYKHIIKENANKKSIVQLSLKGEYLNTYDSLQEASDNNDDIKVKGISKCCNGIRKSYKNYIWLFEENYDETNNYQYNAKSTGKSKDILVFDKNMNFIKECNTIDDVVVNYGYSRTSLYNHLHNRGNRIKEHIFIFKENYKSSSI